MPEKVGKIFMNARRLKSRTRRVAGHCGTPPELQKTALKNIMGTALTASEGSATPEPVTVVGPLWEMGVDSRSHQVEGAGEAAGSGYLHPTKFMI